MGAGSDIRATIEQMRFDSADHPSGERLKRYARFNGPPSRVLAIGPDFAMRATRWRFDRSVLHERISRDVAHERGPDEIVDGLDHLMLHLVVSGDYEIDVGDGLSPVPEGAILLLDMARPMRSRTRGAHILTISVSREVAVAAFGNLADLHGAIVGGAETRPLADYLRSLATHAGDLPASAAIAFTEALMPLLTAALDVPQTPEEAALPDRSAFDRARRLIERRLADPLLGPELIAQKTGLSRATLYRLFQPSGGLMAFIRNRRLDRARTALSNADDRRPLIQLIAEAGFVSESHFSRQFALVYGIRPSVYRERAALLPERDADHRLDYWFSELR